MMKIDMLRVCGILLLVSMSLGSFAQKGQWIYQLRIYHYQQSGQEQLLDNYFREALLPAFHRAGITSVGVFKAVDNDTAADKRIVVFIPCRSLQQLNAATTRVENDPAYRQSGAAVLEAAFDHPAFSRMESILLRAFPLAPQPAKPTLSGPVSERIYELRSYESPTVALHQNKVQMFNQGGEIALFSRLAFNAVFYSSVISGAHMPNLMYMTSFDNMAEREAHWKAFGSDPVWKELSARPEYQHNVSHIDILFLHPAAFSEY